MFGAATLVNWLVSYETNKVVYYLSRNVSGDFTNIVWTRRRDKAERFTSQDEAQKIIAKIKEARNDKTMPLKAVHL